MKHLPQNNINTLTTDSEQTAYPVSNLLDEHPKRLWKATDLSTAATLTLEIVGGCSDIAVFGTNAATTAVDITDPNECEWAVDEWAVDEWANVSLSGITTDVTENPMRKSLWITLSETVPASCVIKLRLFTDKADTVEAGVLRACIKETYGTTAPETGLSEGRIDYSIETQLQNGSRYYKKRDLVRVFDGALFIDRDEFFKLTIKHDELGRQPTAWRMTTESGNDWVVFAYMNDVTGEFINKPKVNAAFELIEVL